VADAIPTLALWINRLISGVFAIVGATFLRTGYPPQGGESMLFLVLGVVPVGFGIDGVLFPGKVKLSDRVGDNEYRRNLPVQSRWRTVSARIATPSSISSGGT